MKKRWDKKEEIEDIGSKKKLKRSQKAKAAKAEKEKNKKEEAKAHKTKRKAHKTKSKAKKAKKKEGIFVPRLTIVLALIFILLGVFPAYSYKSMLGSCTAETTGIVVEEGRSVDSGFFRYYPTRRKRKRYWRKIEVETDGRFRQKVLYASTDAGRKGDEVIIRYDPDDPDEYYIVSCLGSQRAVIILLFGFGGCMIVLSVFLFIHYNKPSKTAKK